MQNDSNVEMVKAEIPAYLQCEPRTYKVKLNHWHEDTCDLEFTIIIKCTDTELHEHNNFWSNADNRLDDNDGDIVAVILKMIGRKVFFHCYGNNFISPKTKFGINSIFDSEGWSPDCFEITVISFDNYIDDDSFEFEAVTS